MDVNGVGWLTAIIVGGLAGWIAEKITRSRISMIGNIILGIIGAVVANFLFQLLGADVGIGWVSYLVAGIVGACLLILLGRAVRGG